MTSIFALEVLLAGVIFIPFLNFFVLAFAALFHISLTEFFIKNLVRTSMIVLLGLTSILLYEIYEVSSKTVGIDLGAWWTLKNYHFEIEVLLDRLSSVYLWLVCSITGIIGIFSSRYLHKDPDYQRFFLVFSLFVTALILVVVSGNLDILIIGWELVGLCSVLLIGFYNDRPQPVSNALHTLVIYKISDVGLFGALSLAHIYCGTSSFSGLIAFFQNNPNQSVIASCFLVSVLWGTMGKSAQFPLSSWLPRAIEGPTSSSAVFYGSLSVHLGPYLLLRFIDLIQTSFVASALIFAVGLFTVIFASLAGSIRADIKTQLAYASMVQIGLIFMEIALGFERLALLHVIGHSLFRTLQFLKAPSAMQDYHAMHPHAYDHKRKPWVPDAWLSWLYRQALMGFYLEEFLLAWIVRPYVSFTHKLAQALPIWVFVLLIFSPVGLLWSGHFAYPEYWHESPMLKQWIAGLLSSGALLLISFSLIEKNTKNNLTYIFLSQLCFAWLSVFCIHDHGGWVAAFQIASIIVTSGCLWILIDMIEERTGFTEFAGYTGLRSSMPNLEGFYLVFSLALVNFPGFFGYVEEDVFLHGFLHGYPWCAPIVLLSIMLSMVSIYRQYAMIFLGAPVYRLPNLDISAKERFSLLVMLIVVILGGVFPGVMI